MTDLIPLLPEAQALDSATIEAAWEYYRRRAIEYLCAGDATLDSLFDTEAEREIAIAEQILVMVDTMDVVSDCVRQRAIQVITRYARGFASWDAIAQAAHEAAGSLTPSGATEHRHIAETVAPFCRRNQIAVEIPPGKFGYLREAASYLAHIINHPDLPEHEKVQRVREELEFIVTAPCRAAVRDRVRRPRGQPAQGGVVQADDKHVIVIHATPETAHAIKVRLGNLVDWNLHPRFSCTATPWRPAHLGDGTQVRNITELVTCEHLELRDRAGAIQSILS